MIEIQPLEKSDAGLIVEWNADKDADFLTQWTGNGYAYPITESQIITRINEQRDLHHRIYKIVLREEMIGTIELIRVDPSTNKARIGRFLLCPSQTGKGYGTLAINEFTRFLFDTFGYSSIGLSVYDFNKAAYRCYEKAGFEPVAVEDRPNGWKAITMERKNL